MSMRLSRVPILLALLVSVNCERDEDQEVSNAFIEEAKSLFTDKDALRGLQSITSAFVQSNVGKQVGDMISGEKTNVDDIKQIVAGIGSLMSNNQQTSDFSLLGTVLETLVSSGSKQRSTRDVQDNEPIINFENIISIGSTMLGQNANSDLLMGLVPMLLENLGGRGDNEGDATASKKSDHTSHAWFLPPFLENIHVMWEHFSNSELGQTLWKKSGLEKIIIQMSDKHGQVQYVKVLDSLENPTLRRRWIKSLTNYVAEWVSHLSDPIIQQRYLTTVQFVGNSFLKSQGFPKTAMFDSLRPTESISRLVDAVAKRYLRMKINSSEYVKPAVAYVQELITLASEKGFIMSRINARELSNKLSDTINNDIVGPILKAYRAYKWSIKVPHCASQVLCTINERTPDEDNDVSRMRSGLLRIASFPAAWAVSNKLGMNFWSLYGAIMEQDGCIRKYPADCTVFHEEEIKATTENVHSEL